MSTLLMRYIHHYDSIIYLFKFEQFILFPITISLKKGVLLPELWKNILHILVSTQVIIKNRNLLMTSIFSNFSLIFISNIKNIRLNLTVLWWPDHSGYNEFASYLLLRVEQWRDSFNHVIYSFYIVLGDYCLKN